jgi:hypothetical protein
MKPPRPSEPTIDLVRRTQHGDAAAREQLLRENLEPLRRWALSRLAPPPDTQAADELVRQSIDAALPEVAATACGCEADIQACLRMNLLRRLGCAGDAAGKPLSQLESEVGPEIVRDYESGLLQLTEADRRLIILRLELGLGYDAIADATEHISAEAARDATTQAIVRLAEAMRRCDGDRT